MVHRTTDRARSFSGALLVLVLGLAACGGDPGTGPGDDGPDDPIAPRVVKAEPSYTDDIQEIWERRGCTASSCHGAGREASLDLRPAVSYAELFNVVSTFDEDFLLVKPFDAQNSYLVMKIEERQTVGVPMPKDDELLDSIDRTNIRNWIDNGAPNN